jgi:hypothetical protein
LSALNGAGCPVQAQQAQDKCSIRTSGPPSQLAGEQNFQNLMECLKELRSATMSFGEVAGLRDELKNARSEIDDLKRKGQALETQLSALGAQLSASINTQDAVITALGGGRILAIAEVKDSNLRLHSEGVEYRSASYDGIITFPNPKNLMFVPVISDSQQSVYITAIHWISERGPHSFTVRANRIGGGILAPGDFVAIVIGFEDPVKGSVTPR